MVHKVIYNLLLLTKSNPVDMTCVQIDDVSRVLMAVMKLEFINAEKSGCLLWLFQSPFLIGFFGVQVNKTLSIDGFNSMGINSA